MTGCCIRAKLVLNWLSINDLVAAVGKYYTLCQCGFENPIPKYAPSGQPPSSVKLTRFNIISGKMEEDLALYSKKNAINPWKKFVMSFVLRK